MIQALKSAMNAKMLYLSGLSIALASTLTLSPRVHAQTAVPPGGGAPAVRRGVGGRGGGAAWILGGTLAQARAFQDAAAASGRSPLNASQHEAVAQMNTRLAELSRAVTAARDAFAAATFAASQSGPAIQLMIDALTNAELALANARAEAFVKLQTSTNSLAPGQIQILVQQDLQGGRGGGPGGRGGGADVNDLEGQVAAGADFSPKVPVQIKTPEEEAKGMILPPGYHMTPILWDPYIQEPTQIAFDGNGRLFVNEMRSYMQDPADASVHQPISRISMHEDLNGDGIFDNRDRHTVFVDGLVATRYVMPLGINSVVVQEYDTLDSYKYTDTNNDGVADQKEVFFAGSGQRGGNVEHQNSGLTWGLDNWLYATISSFRLRWTPTGVIREDSGSLGGQWGVTMDNYGKIYSQGGASGVPEYFQLPIHYGGFNVNSSLAGLAPNFAEVWGAPMIGDMQGGMSSIRMPDNALNRATAGAGNDVFRGDRLPADMVGDYLYGETVARIVRRIRPVVTEGLTQMRNIYTGTEFIKATDPLFRPVDVTTAPDGTLYITDMYRGIIQEANWTGPGAYSRAKIEQYGLDRIVDHGRIFRLTYDGMEPDRTKPNMGNETAAQLVAHLQHPNGWWRDAAQQNLILRQDKSVVPALQSMARTSPSQLGRIHALWTLEGLGALDAAIVREQLKSTDPKIRVQAAQLSERLIKAGDISLVSDVKELAKDSDPNVVIQSMLTVGYIKAPDAVAFIQSTLESNKSAGVTAIGAQLAANGGVGGRGGRGGGGRGGFGGRGVAPGAPGVQVPRSGARAQ